MYCCFLKIRLLYFLFVVFYTFASTLVRLLLKAVYKQMNNKPFSVYNFDCRPASLNYYLCGVGCVGEGAGTKVPHGAPYIPMRCYIDCHNDTNEWFEWVFLCWRILSHVRNNKCFFPFLLFCGLYVYIRASACIFVVGCRSI